MTRGTPGQNPGRWFFTRIRGGDLARGACVVPGKTRGRCLDESCDWDGPFGDSPHNIGRSLYRHTRLTGHRTRFARVELTEYRALRTPESSGRPEDSGVPS